MWWSLLVRRWPSGSLTINILDPACMMCLEFRDLSPFPISPTSMEKISWIFFIHNVLKNILYFRAYPAFCAHSVSLKNWMCVIRPLFTRRSLALNRSTFPVTGFRAAVSLDCAAVWSTCLVSYLQCAKQSYSLSMAVWNVHPCQLFTED